MANLVRLKSAKQHVEIETADVVTDDDIRVELVQLCQKKVEQTEFVVLRGEDDGACTLGDDIGVVLVRDCILPSRRHLQSIELAHDGKMT